uniref:Uncharacterized protein n=1 Tax=Anguilla anguilla TaxID=7936 RepID=A0A0E9X0U7_ANGAN
MPTHFNCQLSWFNIIYLNFVISSFFFNLISNYNNNSKAFSPFTFSVHFNNH